MDTFEKYLEYVEVQETTDKAELMESFARFLDDPMMYGGHFVIRWKENETFENTRTLKEYVDRCGTLR